MAVGPHGNNHLHERVVHCFQSANAPDGLIMVLKQFKRWLGETGGIINKDLSSR